jgi:hypothetical protein
MTMKFTFEETVTIQKHLRRSMNPEMTVMEAYEQAVKTLNEQIPEDGPKFFSSPNNLIVGHPAGYRLDANNRLKRIKNSIPKEHGGSSERDVVEKESNLIGGSSVA